MDDMGAITAAATDRKNSHAETRWKKGERERANRGPAKCRLHCSVKQERPAILPVRYSARYHSPRPQRLFRMCRRDPSTKESAPLVFLLSGRDALRRTLSAHPRLQAWLFPRWRFQPLLLPDPCNPPFVSLPNTAFCCLSGSCPPCALLAL